MAAELTERRERLWIPVIAPVVWAVHFTLCYVTVALWCGPKGPANGRGGLGLAIALYTVAAMSGMVASFVHAFRRYRPEWSTRPHDDDTPEDRRHFMAFTTMLLAGMSLVATAFVALAAMLVDRCP